MPSPAAVRALALAAADLGPIHVVVHSADVSPVHAGPTRSPPSIWSAPRWSPDAFGDVTAPGGAGVVIWSMAAQFAASARGQEVLLTTSPADGLATCPSREVTGSGAPYAPARPGNVPRVAAAASPRARRGARVTSISTGVISTATSRSYGEVR